MKTIYFLLIMTMWAMTAIMILVCIAGIMHILGGHYAIGVFLSAVSVWFSPLMVRDSLTQTLEYMKWRKGE